MAAGPDVAAPVAAGDETPTSRVIIVCHGGYSSSLAAATLQELGLHRATDLAGGFEAWKEMREEAADAGPADGG